MNTDGAERDYFLSNRSKIHVDFAEDAGEPATTMLREAQAGAYWAVRAHFTARDDPAIVVMPTGAGKTAAMTLLAFGLVRRRLLIIAPTRVILEQIAREFETLRIVRKVGCLPSDLDAPKVYIVKHRLGSEEAWKKLRDFDVVVSTAHRTAPRHEGVCYPPQDAPLFDAVFLDEAHHWPAPTWQSLGESFPAARFVGFTATPYRKDKKPIPGEIVYSYPLARAIERGIYRPIEFVPVKGHGDRMERDLRLAKHAKKIWQAENQKLQAAGRKPSASLLVRVDRLKETQTIKNVYDELGVKLEVVTSDKSLKTCEAAIQKVRERKCDGLLAVGMLGEGLDLPGLRIAVLHRPYQSFPITLQLVGRICRTQEGEGTAKLLAIPEEVQEHTQGLYDLDANWVELIPNLADAAVEEERARRQFAKEEWDATTRAGQVSVHTLRPFFSVAAYETADCDLAITRNPKLAKGSQIFQSFLSDDRKWRVLIARTVAKPLWTTSDSLVDVNYDLLIYYRVGDLLFESTTSQGLASQVRASFGGGCARLVNSDRIEQAISQGKVITYYSVGMRKVAYASASVPSYKMMAGKHAEASVRESDGHFFSVGHLFGRVEWNGDEIVLGISGDSAKVWASARDHLKEFTTWCDKLAARLMSDLSVSLPYVSHLKSPEVVDSLTAPPYAAEFQEGFYDQLEQGLRLEVKDVDGITHSFEGKERFELLADKKGWDDTTPHKCRLTLTVGDLAVAIQYDIQTEKLFQCEPQPPFSDCLVKVPEKGRKRDLSLEDYLFRFPPKLYLTDGSVIVGKNLYRYEPPAYTVREGLFVTKDWKSLNCEITVEDIEMVKERRRIEIEKAGKISVLDATAKILPSMFSADTFIFNDHHKGELADYVALEPEGDTLRIHLIHCKASDRPNPGARQKDASDVLAQARKCARWMRRSDLFDTMKEHLAGEKVVQGTVEGFEGLVARCTPQTARYSVHLVQPGFDIAKIQKWHDPSIRLMMVSLYDELSNDGVRLRVVGS